MSDESHESCLQKNYTYTNYVTYNFKMIMDGLNSRPLPEVKIIHHTEEFQTPAQSLSSYTFSWKNILLVLKSSDRGSHFV